MSPPPIDPSIAGSRSAVFPGTAPARLRRLVVRPLFGPGEEDARLMGAIDAAYDDGVRHFDTAGGYGDGHSEEIYGGFLAGRRARSSWLPRPTRRTTRPRR